MGYRADLSFRRYTLLKMRIGDIYRKHIQFKSPHTAILEDLKRSVYETNEYRRLPAFYRFTLSEYSGWNLNRIHCDYVEWRLGPESGPIRVAGDPWTDEISALCNTPGALYGSHFWIGSDRLFGEWKPTNEKREEVK